MENIVKVAGLWEQGWTVPIIEIDSWEYPLRDFCVNQFYMTPVSGVTGRWITEKNDIQEIIDENPDLTIVWVDETAETTLSDFEHPDNALYIMGRTSTRPMITYGNETHKSVKIETKPDGSNQGMLWSHQSICIVLYDRLIKSINKI
jgi:hypothetical protein